MRRQGNTLAGILCLMMVLLCGGQLMPVVTAATITAMEYYIDTDPGVGSATPIPPLDGAYDSTNEVGQISIDTTGLAPGPHWVYVRALDTSGVWGTYPPRLLNVYKGSTTVARVECYFDIDPGPGNGTPLLAVDGALSSSSERVTAPVATTGLSVGNHTLYIRACSSAGIWGVTRAMTIQVLPAVNVIAAQCGFGTMTDTSPTLGTYWMQSADGAFDSQNEQIVYTATAPATVGNYQVFVQGENALPVWGAWSSATVQVELPPVALFNANPTNGIMPLMVAFTDTSTSTITNRFWDFGDGTTLNTTLTNVTHTYTSAGNYMAQLMVSGPLGASTNSQTIIVRFPPPVAVCQSQVVLPADINCQATVTIAMVDGGSTGLITNEFLTPSGPYGRGTNNVTLTVQGPGGISSCGSLVVVQDNTAPTITAPADKTVNTDFGQCYASAVVLGSPVTSDNCGVAGVTNNAPLHFPKGTNAVTWTVTDTSGNTATATQKVIVNDIQSPTITAPADKAIVTDIGQSFASGVALGSPVTGDNCGVAAVTNNAPAQFPIGTNSVVWMVTDTSGNAAAATQTVIVAQCMDSVTITPSIASGGTTSGNFSTNCGSSVSVWATPNAGYVFINWTEGGTVVASTPVYTFNVTSDRNLVANLALCTYSLPSSSGRASATSSSDSFTVNCLPGCDWSAATGTSWLHTSSAGSGTGLVSYTVDAMTCGGARTGTVSVAGQTFTVMQTGVACTLSLGSSATNILAASASGTFTANVPCGCPWSAVPSAAWVKTSSSGNGTGVVSFTVDANIVTNGRTGTITVQGQTFTITQAARAPFAVATFNGLIIQTNAPAHASSGSIKVVPSKTGTFAANMSLGGVASAFRGAFDAWGNATNIVPRAKLAPVKVILHLDLFDGTDEITGSVSDGTTFTSQLLADKAVYSASYPCPWAGKYNCLLAPTTNNPAIPQGDGYATLTVVANGSGALAGTLADGTAISGTMPFSKFGTWPWYKLLYANKGACVGWLSISSSNTVNAVVDWFKPNVTSGRYAAGFNTALTLSGTRVPPSSGVGTWQLTLGGGELPSNLVRNATITGTGAAIVTPVDGYKLKLKVTPTTGKFTGSFLHPATKKTVSFNGLFLQPPENEAGGFFLGPNTSGAVTLEP